MKSFCLYSILTVTIFKYGALCDTDIDTTTQEEIITELGEVLSQIAAKLQSDNSRSVTSVITDTIKPMQKRRPGRWNVARCSSRNQILCDGSRPCIEKSSLCDGQYDCPKKFRGWDESPEVCRKYKQNRDRKRSQLTSDFIQELEKRGKPRKCKDGSVSCGKSRQCIPPDYMCDEWEDCKNGWDEDPDVCGKRTCPKDKMKCDGSGECINVKDMCDNYPTCKSGWDEDISNCGKKRCDSFSTLCTVSNICLPNVAWCDGHVDCREGEDETTEMCLNVPCDGLRCSDGVCVNTKGYCDGLPDCPDGADEEESRCGPVTCPADTLRCDEANYCVPLHTVCDYVTDCPNGADETEEQCSAVSREPYHEFWRKTQNDDIKRNTQTFEADTRGYPAEGLAWNSEPVSYNSQDRVPDRPQQQDKPAWHVDPNRENQDSQIKRLYELLDLLKT